mgnify:CR=1 FL=1
MKRSPLTRKTALTGRRKSPKKTGGIDYLALCRGQQCYLRLPHVTIHDPATVVACHSNQSIHGKGMGLKASDEFTVPGCYSCHMELDQGRLYTRQQKFDAWDAAYARWKSDREKLLKGEKDGTADH